MSPIRSIGSKSVGKLLNVFRSRDAVGPDKLNSKFYTNRKVRISASGGTALSPGDGFNYFVFTSPGTWVVSDGVDDVEYIIVAGGGGGATSGGGTGGGGGAGGMLKQWPSTLFTGPGTARNVGPGFPAAPGTYTITIGAGGAGGAPPTYPFPPDNRAGAAGSPSSIAGPTIATITAIGGGLGKNESPPYIGGSGGSGGGAGGGPSPYVGGTATDFPGTSQQGYPGGASGSASQYGGGGGGSAYPGGSTGWDGPKPAASGGDGDGFGGIPGSYGTPGPNPLFRYFAGGGGGSNNLPSAPGGYGGGGAGAVRLSTPISSAGQINTGGGGGGGADPTGSPSYHGRPGGSGIVVIRCLAP